MTGNRDARYVLCPRCEINRYTRMGANAFDPDTDPPYPALSRVAHVYVCSPCGTDEALRDFTGAAPLGVTDWPITKAGVDWP